MATESLFPKDGGYLKLLQPNPAAVEVFEDIQAKLDGSPELMEQALALFEQGWREQLVGLMVLVARPSPVLVRALWRAFDRGSWVAPQLAVVARLFDADFEGQAKKRLLLECPLIDFEVLSQMDPKELHTVHGPGGSISRSAKNFASLVALLPSLSDGAVWLKQRLSFEQIVRWIVIEDDWDKSPDIVARWATGLWSLLRSTGREPSGGGLLIWSRQEIAREWPLQDGWGQAEQKIKTILESLVRAGAESVSWTYAEKGDRLSGTGSSGECSLVVGPPYHWLARQAVQDELRYCSGILLHNCRLVLNGRSAVAIELEVTSSTTRARIRLTRSKLEDCGAQILVHAIDDSGNLDFGSGSALRLLCGADLQHAVHEELADTGKGIGTLIYTGPYAIYDRQVHKIAHVVASPRKGRCTSPEPLAQALAQVLQIYGGRHVGVAAMATGGRGLSALDLAQAFFSAVASYFVANPYSGGLVTFCLPDPDDHRAFEKVHSKMS